MKHVLAVLFTLFTLVTSSAFASSLGGSTSIQGQDQNQGQAQGQAQGLINANSIEVSNRIGNDVRNRASAQNLTTTDVRTNNGGNTLTVNEAPIPANTTQAITYGGKYEVKNVPNVFSGNVYPTSPCMGSSTVGGAGAGFGFSVGSSWTDDECGIRETSRSFNGLGHKEDALSVLCTSKYAAAAPSCKKAALEAVQQ
jgi:hypothetical protein